MTGNAMERKLVSLLRATVFHIYRLRQLAYFVAGLLSRQWQPVSAGQKMTYPGSYPDERYKPFLIQGTINPAGMVAVAECIKHKPNALKFSVVIPTKDRLDDLTACVQSIIAQSKKPSEIIVVDGSTHQPIEQMIDAMCQQEAITFKYIKQTEGKFGRAKNLGVMQAEGDIVLFVDDDVILDERYIEELERVYQRDGDGLVGGVKGTWAQPVGYSPIREAYGRLFLLGGVSRDKADLLPSGACFVPMKLSSIKRADGFIGPAHSYHRSVFDEFKFDEEFEEGDELNFSARVSRKYELYITPHAKFVHNQKLAGRNIEADQTMDTYTRYYIFRRLMPQTSKNKLCFVWSHIGWLIGYLGVFLVRPTSQNYAYLKGSIKGTVMIFRSVIQGKETR